MISPLLGLVIQFVLLHPVHATFAEAEWNDQSNRLEVALQLDSLDEQLIDQILKKQTEQTEAASQETRDLDQTDLVIAKRIQYLSKHFRVTSGSTTSGSTEGRLKTDANRNRYHWVGRQEKGAHVWWYFEIELPSEKKPAQLHQSILLDQDDRYQHRVLLLNSQPSVTLTFNHDVTVRRMDGNHE